MVVSFSSWSFSPFVQGLSPSTYYAAAVVGSWPVSGVGYNNGYSYNPSYNYGYNYNPSYNYSFGAASYVPFFSQSFPNLSLRTYNAAGIVGSWYGRNDGFGFPSSRYGGFGFNSGYNYSTGYYHAGDANQGIPDRVFPKQWAGGYPPALEDRARNYVRTALGKPWVAQFNRPATAYDAYNTAQHGDISKNERYANAEGREKAVWELADSLKWVDDGNKRAEYSAASDAIRNASGSYSEKLAIQVANLIAPGSSELSEEVVNTAARLCGLSTAELPSKENQTLNSIMAAVIKKLGGESVAQALVDEVSAQVAWRGVTTKGRDGYIADLEKKRFKGPDAVAVYDKLMANKTDAEKRLMLNRMGEVKKPDKKDATAEKEQYDLNARVAAMHAMDVKNDEELNALYEKYKAKSFSDFLDAMRRDVESGTIPKAPAGTAPSGRH